VAGCASVRIDCLISRVCMAHLRRLMPGVTCTISDALIDYSIIADHHRGWADGPTASCAVYTQDD